jgi:hypothetical protein
VTPVIVPFATVSWTRTGPQRVLTDGPVTVDPEAAPFALEAPPAGAASTLVTVSDDVDVW